MHRKITILIFLFAFLFVSQNVYAYSYTVCCQASNNTSVGTFGSLYTILDSSSCTMDWSSSNLDFAGYEKDNNGVCRFYDICDGVCPAPSSCTDGIKNGTETGVDCGGSCLACSSSTCTGEKIGGCNGLSEYCDGSPEFESAVAFTNKFPYIAQWWYYVTEFEGVQYKCMNFYKDDSGKVTLNIYGSASANNPVGNDSCVTSTTADAMACLNPALNGVYSGLTTKYTAGTGIKGICKDSTTGAFINCGVVKTDVGDGKTVTQNTGTGDSVVTGSGGSFDVIEDTRGDSPSVNAVCFDDDKNGVDDFTGVPCVTGGATGGKVGASVGGACTAYTYKNNWDSVKAEISTALANLPLYNLINKLLELTGQSGFPHQYTMNIGGFIGSITLDLDAWHFNTVLAVLRWSVLFLGFGLAWRLAIGGE